jgi:hypothetical protein
MTATFLMPGGVSDQLVGSPTFMTATFLPLAGPLGLDLADLMEANATFRAAHMFDE